MTEEEREEELTMLAMYAAIALPGILGKAMWVIKEDIAAQAFDIAEAMIVEYKKRKDVSES